MACLTSSLVKNLPRLFAANKFSFTQAKRYQGLLSFEEVEKEKPQFHLKLVKPGMYAQALDLLKRHYLPEHVFVRARNMDLTGDHALDEYLTSVIKQGNTIVASTEDGQPAGICVGFAASPVDVVNLRSYAFHRQDPNTKDFLYFLAKLQETPNMWTTFKQTKIFEVKMVAVVPEHRRKGLASSLVETCKSQAHDQGFDVIRMNCINPQDYKVAERCMLHCVVKYPLHKLRGPHAPFVKKNSPYNCWVRIYVSTRPQPDHPDTEVIKRCRSQLEELIE